MLEASDAPTEKTCYVLLRLPTPEKQESIRVELMNKLAVQIERFVDDHFPGFVECAFIDAEGVRHGFVEKLPIVSEANLNAESVYPQPGHIDCTIEERWLDELGRSVARINIDKPWSVESLAGLTLFTVYEEELSAV
jgi:hypothetical protein